MLWRPEYQTVVLRGVELPEIAGSLLSGGPWRSSESLITVIAPGVSDLRDLEIWWRLLASADLAQASVAVFHSAESPDLLRSLLPPSRHPRTATSEKLALWSAVVAQNAVLAAIPLAGLAMVGPPTEDAWEEFEEAAIRLR